MSANVIEFRHRPAKRHSPVLAIARALNLHVVAWRRRARARRDLLAADARMLADLGISHAEAQFRAVEGLRD